MTTDQTATLAHRRVIAAGLGLIGAQLAFRAWAVFGGWFHIDDFNFMSRAMSGGISPRALVDQYMGHLMPAGQLLSWVNNRVAPFDWWLPASELWVLQAMADLGLMMLLIRLFGPRAGILVPLAIYLFSAASIPVFIWWAAGINQLPMHLTLFWGLRSFLQHLRTRTAVSLLASWGWLIIGLLFWEKSVLNLLAYAFLALAYFASGGLVDRVRHIVTHFRLATLGSVVLGAAYLSAYVASGLSFSPQGVADNPLLGTGRAMVFSVAIPTLVGGPLRWRYLPGDPGAVPDPSDPVVVIATLAVGWLVWEIHRARTRSLRAWALPLIFLAADIALVVAARTGPGSTSLRYQSEIPGLVAIALGLATMAIRGAVETAEPARPSALIDQHGRIRAVTIAVIVLATVSARQFVLHWQADHRAEAYVTSVRKVLDTRRQPLRLVDRPVPESLTWGYNFPENLFSRVFAAQTSAADFPRFATDDLFIFDNQGTLRSVLVTAVRRAEPGGEPGCGYRLGQTPTVISLDGPLDHNEWWARIGYIASDDSVVTVALGNREHTVPIRSGLHALFVSGSGRFDTIAFGGLAGEASLCTDDITVGLPEPAPGDTP